MYLYEMHFDGRIDLKIFDDSMILKTLRMMTNVGSSSGPLGRNEELVPLGVGETAGVFDQGPHRAACHPLLLVGSRPGSL